MLSPNPSPANPSPAAEAWTQRFDRFLKADVTVAQFCRAEGVSQAAYYYWRRKLRGDSRSNTRGGQSISLTKPPASFLPVALPARPEDPIVDPAATMTIELPGGIRVRLELPVDSQGDRP